MTELPLYRNQAWTFFSPKKKLVSQLIEQSISLWFFLCIVGIWKCHLDKSEQVSHLALMAPRGTETGASLQFGANTNLQEQSDQNRPLLAYRVAQAAMNWMRNILQPTFPSCRAPPPFLLSLFMWLFALRGQNTLLGSNQLKTAPEGIATVENTFVIVKENKHKSTKYSRTELDFIFTIFIAGNRNVVDSSELETGAGQDLELHRT